MKFLYLGAVIVLIIGVVIFFVFNRRTKNGTTVSEKSVLNEMTANENTNYLHPSAGGKTIYYFDELQANFFNIEQSQTPKTLTDSKFITVKKVVWSNNDRQVLIKVLNHQYPYQGTLSPVSDPNASENAEIWWLYDFTSQKASKIREGISNAIFSPNSEKISYAIANEGIYISSPNGQASQKIVETNNGFPVDWSQDGQKILIQSEDNGSPALLVIDANSKKQLNNIDQAENGRFSPNGKMIFYDSSQDFEQTKLAVYNLETQTSQDIKLETISEKIAWFDDNYLIAAVSEKNENFYKVKINGNVDSKLIYSTGRSIDAKNQIVSPDKKYLYFLSGGNIYRLDL